MAPTGSFRREMLEAQAPPAARTGRLRWLQENLFSSWPSALLTLLSLAAILWLVAHVWPWFAHSVWDAGSLTECRAIIRETWGGGASGACFAVIRERCQQFLCGF